MNNARLKHFIRKTSASNTIYILCAINRINLEFILSKYYNKNKGDTMTVLTVVDTSEELAGLIEDYNRSKEPEEPLVITRKG